jgi:rubrerythrin
MAREHSDQQEKLPQAYHEMLERIFDEQQQTGAVRGLQHYIETAKEKAVALGELSREEAERIGDYLRRDLHDAADYLSESGGELKDWLRFDMRLVEDRILDMFGLMVDHTREELDRLQATARSMSEWQTGEVTGPGSLACENCGKLMEFHKPGRIPPCPVCHATRFKRLTDDDSPAASDSAAESLPPDTPA